MYVIVKFAKDRFQDIMDVLVSHGFPVSSFVGSIDQMASEKGMKCTRCLGPVDDKAKHVDPKELYGFFTLDTAQSGDFLKDMISAGFTTVFLSDKLDELCRELCAMCVSCKGHFDTNVELSQVVESNEAVFHHDLPRGVITVEATSSGELDPSLWEKQCATDGEHSSNASNSNGGASDLLAQIKAEMDETDPDVEITDDNDWKTQLDIQDMNDSCGESPGPGEKKNWTKCNLCMRILRTRKYDTSRMKTLQNSHARNHVSKPQYSCQICNFGCRFQGGIQLHMNRNHEGNVSAFVDRSKEQWFRNEIQKITKTCFGADTAVTPKRYHITYKQ